MENTNTIIMNDYATAIAENRFIASAQLSADDFTSTETTKASVLWKNYRAMCDVLAIACKDSLTPGKNMDDDLVGTALAGLFNFFGTDAKATTANKNRILLACVTITRKQSDAMKKARKEKTAAKKKYDEAVEAKKPEADILALKQDWDAKVAIVEEMEGQPHNVWYDKKPQLDKAHAHATPKCRKLIEDTIADIMTERAMMSEEDKAKEQQELDDQRAGRELRKKQEAKEAKKNQNKTEAEATAK